MESKKKDVISRKFGKIGNAASFMANYDPNQMSTFQQYTGVPPGQMNQHLKNVSMSLRDNFYTSFE